MEGVRSPSRFSNNNNHNNSYIEVNNSVIIVSNTPGAAYKQGSGPVAPGGARIGRRVKNAAAKRDMKCVCLAKEAGTKSAQTHVPAPADEERKSNLLKSYLDTSIYPGNPAPPEKGTSEKTVKPGKRAGGAPGASSANTSFECYSSPSNQYPLFVKRRTPAGTSHALASGVGAVVFSPAAAARQVRASIKKPYSVLTRALKRPATRNVGDSGSGTPYESANGGGRFTSVASRSSSR